ncbi:MAG: CBS domain-containing protein [Bacillota bacterium]|nr:CBS domain-containing protein [Bacillota bacterium]
MPKEKKVRDLMIPIEEYATVPQNATVREAVAAVASSFKQLPTGEYTGHRSVLVLDGQRRLVGLLTYRDLIRAVEPQLLDADKLPRGLPWEVDVPDVPWEGFFEQRSRAEAQKPVSEVMRPLELITVDADAPLLKAIHLMLTANIGSVPVMENGVIVGMVRMNEVFKAVADAVL